LSSTRRRCLQEEAIAIAAAAPRLNSEQVKTSLQLLERCRAQRAKLVVTGVGKSGIDVRKITATFSSIGLTAVFLNLVDALHGDLGIVAADDVALLLPNSGETEELLAILPYLRRRGTARIALVERIHSSLSSGSDGVLDGSVDREFCPSTSGPPPAPPWPWPSAMPCRLYRWSGPASPRKTSPSTTPPMPSC
jgi:arabinose-5-phosphate isomerase